MPGGTVKWFDHSKGWGFITSDDEGDVFVHFSSIKDGGLKTLQKGERVTFDIIKGALGPQAAHVIRQSHAD